MVEVLGRSLVAGVGSEREQLRVIRVIARHRLVLNVAGRGLWGDLGGVLWIYRKGCSSGVYPVYKKLLVTLGARLS